MSEFSKTSRGLLLGVALSILGELLGSSPHGGTGALLDILVLLVALSGLALRGLPWLLADAPQIGWDEAFGLYLGLFLGVFIGGLSVHALFAS